MQLFVPFVFAALASAVSAGCSQIAGNYYCNPTSKVVYNNIGFSGSYMDVTDMNEETGKCTQSLHSFSGNLSPFDEELSVHFRGPLKLLQFGVYYPASGSNQKRDTEDCSTQHIHHKHKRATAVEYETQTVYIDGNGNTQTAGVPASAATPSSAAPVVPVISEGNGKAIVPTTYSVLPSSTSLGVPTPSASSTAGDGDWERVSYYTPGSASNCTFMNYYGGSGSGVWSSAFGNSLSYANADNSGGSSSPVALESTTLKSNTEFVIFSGSKCSGDLCGYYRANTPAYHGYGGTEKVFVFEFEMPSDSNTGFNVDMPAIWMLNAKIPRTLQYGDASCSCWSTGCGELDLFEILSAGSDKCITHLHDKQGAVNGYGGGGSQDYFVRPTSGSMKAAVVFTGSQIHVLEVTDSFDATLSAETVEAWVSKPGSIAAIGY